MHRQSEDVGHMNNSGLLLLDFCKQTGLRIMNGRVGQDREIGRYTFVGNRGSSLVDYVLGSQEMFNFVKSFEVQEPNILSDHCVVIFSLKFGSCMMQENESDNYDRISEKYTWKNDVKDEYVNRLNYESTNRQLNLLNLNISECSNESDIHSCVSEFVNIIHNVSAPLFKKSIKTEKCNNPFSNEKQNPECQEKKIDFLYMLDKYRQSKSDENRANMVTARSEYKSLIRRCRYKFDREKTEKKNSFTR